MTPIAKVESVCPRPAPAAVHAVCRSDQRCWRARTAMGAQWSGTIVCKTPMMATAASSSSIVYLRQSRLQQIFAHLITALLVRAVESHVELLGESDRTLVVRP